MTTRYANYDELRFNMDVQPDRYLKQNSSYTLFIDDPGLAPAASGQPSFRIDTESVFVWQKTTYLVDLAAAAITQSSRVIPLLTVQITDTGSGRTMYDIPQPLANVAGTGEIPFLLPAHYLFQPGATVNSVIENYSAGETYTRIYISLLGYRVFDLFPNEPKAPMYPQDAGVAVGA